MRRRAALLAVAVAAWALPAPGHGAPESISWEEMRSLMSGQLQAARSADGRWILSAEPGAPRGRAEAAAREALAAAGDHIAWIGSAILESDPPEIPPGVRMPAPLPPAAAEALFREPAFAGPLRRFASAALAGRGLSCSGCLEGLPPSRDIRWEELRAALGAFIFVREVGEDGRIDLRVGTLSSSLPPLERCDRALAAASHAIMRGAALEEPVVQNLVSRALQADLDEMGGFPPEVLQRKLNESLPLRVLTDPLAMRPLILRAVEVLDLHGLRCTDCAQRLPRRGR